MFKALTTTIKKARLARIIFASFGSALLFCVPAAAHEYWISAEDFTVSPGETVVARLMVGQMMAGNELPRLSRQIRTFRYYAPDGPQEAVGRQGDRPAFAYEAAKPGLHIIAQETLPLEVTYDTMEEFSEYLTYEGLGRFVSVHLERGLPEAGFSEAYSRFAKALVQVGPVQATHLDRQVGLAFELTAMQNPYAGLSVLPVELMWQGAAAADTQIAVFRALEGEVERTLVTTGPDGRAEIPLHEAGGRYLLNAVHLEPAKGDGPVWESSWASLTFEVPAR